jgi:glycine betaine catabolism A
MNVRENMLGRLRNRRLKTPLDRGFYCGEEEYRLDLEMIWYRDWLFVGHDCEVAKAGDYMTVQIGAYPVLIVRDRDGGLRAFHNSCRHRGSRICSPAHGNSPRLVCPYHQWTYQLDGRLIAARDMGTDFERAHYGLKPVHCTSVGGYIWVCVAETAPDFETVRKLIEPYFLPHSMQDTKVAFESTIVERANWKLVWENNRECYHCAANHPELCRTYPEDPAVTGVDAGKNNPRIAAKWAKWEALGLPSAFHIAPSGQYRTARMPLIEGTVSYTMNGTAAVRRPLADAVTEPDVGTLLLFHYPSIWNHIMGDHASSFRMLPLSATETQLTTKWLVHRDAVEGVDYDLKTLTEVWLATNEEDRRICQENQLGVMSPGYDPAPYSPVHEDGVVQFVDWYCSHLQGRLLERT